MERVKFTENGEWNCPRCGVISSGKKCLNCKFLIYAGFIPRLVAGAVDGVILWSIAKLFLFLRCNSLDSFLAITIFGFLFFRLYRIMFVALWGQTPGKMAARIHIVRLDGSPVGWRHAILRDSVDLGLIAVLYYYEIHAALVIPRADFAAALIEQREALMQNLMPSFTNYISVIGKVYVWSEYVVMFLNKRKRAIHDFIGGTVVIHDPRQAIFPWRRVKFMRDIEDKMEEISFDEFLENHNKRMGSGKSDDFPDKG